MKKRNSFLVAAVLVILVSCNNKSEDKDKIETIETIESADTVDASIQTKPSVPINDSARAQDNTKVKSAKPDPIVTAKKKSNEILANIDKYLVSKPVFPNPPAKGGIVDGRVTIENTLPDITFQKAIVEVNILLEDGTEYRTDYYTIQNIEPGDIKTVPIPKTTRGTKVTSHIVKLKSDQLTNGEMIIVGSKLVPH